MKRYKLLAITLILTIVLSGLNVFAAAYQEPPTDPNNPQITVVYAGTEVLGGTLTINSMKINVTKGSLTGKCDIDGMVYELNKSYPAKTYDSVTTGYYYEGKNLYKFNKIGETTSGAYDESMNGQTVSAIFTYTYELIPTVEHPKSSSVLTIQHNDSITKKTDEKYYVNKKETTKDKYNKSKIGSWKEKTSTKYVKDLDKKLIRKEEQFTGTTEKDAEIRWSDGTVEKYKKAFYSFQIDEYYSVTQQYLKTYELTTDITPTSQNVKPTLKTKVSIKTPSKTKTSVTAKWKKLTASQQKQVSKIEVQISKSKNFASYTSYKVSKKSTSQKFTKLKRKTKYYVRVRTIKGSKVGPWSTIKSIKTK